MRPPFNIRFKIIGKKSTSAEAGSDIADADEIAKAIKDHIADWSDEEFDDDWKHRNARKVHVNRYQWKLAKKGLRKSVRERPTFDARDLTKKYQDTVWAEDIQIERMSLCKTDRKAKFQGSNNEILLEDEYEEIASIPLPSEAEAEIE